MKVCHIHPTVFPNFCKVQFAQVHFIGKLCVYNESKEIFNFSNR